MTKINIVISFDKNYFKQSIICINSLLKVTEPTTIYSLYCLIDDNVTEEIKKIFIDSFDAKYFNKIAFLNANNYFDKLYISRHITRATYFRLFLHRLISVDKIIYFDVDMIFKKSIKDIYNIDMQNHVVAAVNDLYINLTDTWYSFKKKYSYWSYYFNDSYKGKYFNAGFLLLNLDKIRTLDIDDYILELCSHSFEYHDQDILNILAINKFKKVIYLSACYNVFSTDINKFYGQACLEKIYPEKNIDSIINNATIIHYVGEKPWNNTKIPMAKLWWEESKNTPYYSYFFYRHILVNKFLNFFFSINKNSERVKIKIIGINLRFKRKLFKL